MSRPQYGRQCTSTPLLHAHESGPALKWALRAPKAKHKKDSSSSSSSEDEKKEKKEKKENKEKKPKKEEKEKQDEEKKPKKEKKDKKEKKVATMRRKWDERHNITWQNDLQNPNMRNYFDRFVDRVDKDHLPKRILRPTWNLHIPEDPAEDSEVYRIWDAWHAHWKDQRQWAPAKLRDDGEIVCPPPQASGVRVRTPRNGSDLKVQRGKEKEWDRQHAVTFSRYNQTYNPNFRSYFDRWKDDVAGPEQEKEPTWKLVEPRVHPLHRSRSSPVDRSIQRFSLPGQKPWQANFNTGSAVR